MILDFYLGKVRVGSLMGILCLIVESILGRFGRNLGPGEDMVEYVSFASHR